MRNLLLKCLSLLSRGLIARTNAIGISRKPD